MKLFLWSRKRLTNIISRNRDISYLKDDKLEMKLLFRKVEKVMSEKRPYLESDFSMDDLSKLVFVNRSFLSKTINKISHMNFRTYINSYRIKYAASLIKKDPRMRFRDVAYMSGFNSLPTFNSAFKDVMSMRPSDYFKTLSLNSEQSSPNRTTRVP